MVTGKDDRRTGTQQEMMKIKEVMKEESEKRRRMEEEGVKKLVNFSENPPVE